MHINDGDLVPNYKNNLDVRIWPGQWHKRVIARGNRLDKEEAATREDIMMVLADIDLFLIRYLFENFLFVYVL